MEALIHLLQKDPHLPLEEMGRLLGMPPAEVAERIEGLREKGILLGYTAVINREKWNPDIVTAVIEVKITPERDGGFDRIAARIAHFEEVLSCYLVSGGYDLLVLVEGRSLREVASFVAEKLSTIGPVQSTATRFRLKTYKENGHYHDLSVLPERLAVSP
jgi:DNA-binding Lrp family transcriptional regulator